ncbi:hypothetical protein Hanom_Chr12g01088371 [Helianthus anomalus]
MNRRCFSYSFPHILGFLSFFSFPLCRLFTDIQRSSIHQFESRFCEELLILIGNCYRLWSI